MEERTQGNGGRKERDHHRVSPRGLPFAGPEIAGHDVQTRNFWSLGGELYATRKQSKLEHVKC